MNTEFNPPVELEEETEETTEEEVESEEESEEVESEEEYDEDGEEEEEPRKEDAPIFFAPEIPENKPMSYDQYYTMAYDQLVMEALKANNIPFNADGSNLKDVIRDVAQSDPMGWQKTVDWAKDNATSHARQYADQYIIPYNSKVTEAKLANYLNKFATKFPDVGKYLPEMTKLQKSVYKEWPELADDPVQGIPMLYQLAKEKSLAKASSTVKSRKVMLESGGARTRKDGNRKTSELDRIFNKPDPLKGIFG